MGRLLLTPDVRPQLRPQPARLYQTEYETRHQLDEQSDRLPMRGPRETSWEGELTPTPGSASALQLVVPAMRTVW